MDFDEFDDDIPDEDLIIAASQVPDRSRVQSAKPGHAPLKTPHIHRGQIPGSRASLGGSRTAQSGNINGSSFFNLEDLPSNAFSSSPITGAANGQISSSTGFRQAPRVGGQSQSFRQTTLFGYTLQREPSAPSSQFNGNRAFRGDLSAEPPTHHQLDLQALKTWVYPTNLGTTRDYQYSIVKNGLFNNTLVALPTGLGKTFIAATIMLNYFRWMKKAKIVFVAPTKPLVSQQVDACFYIAGIPRSETTLLTGEIPAGRRAEEWESKRVFFITPQTLENDLSSGCADPKSIGLLVVDEAHRSTGNYSYVKVVSFLRRFSSSFRVLALTATPGSKVEAVQEVIDNLGISHVEIRTEKSIDIRQYIHQRDEEIISLDPSDEMNLIKELFTQTLKPFIDKISGQNIYRGRDPMSLTTYGILEARKEWSKRGGQHANQGLKMMMNAVFSVLASLAHGIKLLNFHGIKPFYEGLVQFRDEVESKGQKGSKYKRQIVQDKSFIEMMNKISSWLKKDDFVGHPKLTCLSETVMNHFLDAGDGREGSSASSTRIIVFSEYRDSAEEIVRVLNVHSPLVRAAVFVGQANSKRSDGMKQAEQIERIKKFKSGDFNVLVATSIGEEGLDIGQVDLIICYDASASPIRMLQRMGRTGRKRAGRVVLLLMKGKEEDNYAKSKDGYEKMQAMICEGSRFSFRHDLSTRIVPREFRPEVDMRAVEIPIENTQVQGLPEPKKGRARKKKPPKKFHMPDGVETGFATVASLLRKKTAPPKTKQTRGPVEEDELAEIPPLDRVFLNHEDTDELNRLYKILPYFREGILEHIEEIDLTAHPQAQRTLRKTVHVKHGEYTKRNVRLLQKLAVSQSPPERFKNPYGTVDNTRYKDLPLPVAGSDTEDELRQAEPARKKRKVVPRQGYSDDEDDIEELSVALSRVKTPAKKAPGRKKHELAKSIVDLDGSAPSDDEVGGRPQSHLARKRTVPKTKKAASKVITTVKRPRGRPKNSKRQAGSAAYDESADEGDDCRRTSDLELTDDSDDGADLEGFVVGDDVATSSNVVPSSLPRHGSTSSATTVIPSTPPTGSHVKQRKFKSDVNPTQSTQGDSDEDDEVPSMSQLVRDQRSSSIAIMPDVIEESDDDDDEDDEDLRPLGKGAAPNRGKRWRTVLEDDDDDESEE
ncbi:P-loop containing nucleoside triphosphate hydrolase protein [Xylariomycetidae sp. FL2044]|nr:P-loop containing nucleoside triphosphate hydrolase protein [Xylariomycetidae sp. FL2044]